MRNVMMMCAVLMAGACAAEPAPADDSSDGEATSSVESDVQCGSLAFVASDGFHGSCSCGDFSLPCSGSETRNSAPTCHAGSICVNSCKRSGHAFLSGTQGTVFTPSTGWSCIWTACRGVC